MRIQRPALAALVALTVSLTAACGGDSNRDRGPQRVADPGPQVVFSYPLHGQAAVPVGSDVVVRLREPMADGDAPLRLLDEQGQPVAASLGVFDAGRVLRLSPAERLRPGQHYRLVHEPFAADAPLLEFATQPAGPRTGQPFELVERLGEQWPLVSFSSLRLRFSKPLDAGSVVLGDSVRLLDPDQRQVPGTLRVSGDRLVFDPREALTAASYRLILDATLRSRDGEPLGEQVSLTLTPTPAGQSSTQRMLLAPSTAAGEPAQPSALVGQTLNSMQLRSGLIGGYDLPMSGVLDVVVADPRNFRDLIPFSVPRGQLIEAGALEVALGGEIAAGLASGPLTIEFLGDADGYFMKNPYQADGPVAAVLFMELGVSVANPLEQSVINTEVLHVRAAGTLEMVRGELHAEMFGALELPLLGGADRGTAMFSLKMHGPEPALEPAPAVPPLQVVSSLPAAGDGYFSADDSIVVNFTSALDPDSVRPQENLLLTDGAGNPVAFDHRVEGASLLLEPSAPLGAGTAYRLTVDAGLRSVAGAEFGDQLQIDWQQPQVAAAGVPPQLLALNPGVPCVLTGGDAGHGGEDAGRCLGGQAGDSRYPLFELRGRGVVEAYFNQPMDPATLQLGEACDEGSLRIERLDADGACSAAVPGYLRVSERRLTFVPDRPWEVQARYRLTLDAAQIRGANGLALNTNVLQPQPGSQPVVIPLRGAAATDTVYLPLSPWPRADLNGDGRLGSGEVRTPAASVLLRVTGSDGLVSRVVIDDDATADDRSGYTYLNYDLINEIGALEHGADGRARLPVRVTPQFLHGTAVDMRVDLLLPLPLLSSRVTTDQLIVRPRAAAEGEIVLNPAGDGGWFRVDLPLYLDAPAMALDLAGDLVVRDPRALIQSQQLTLELEGPLSYRPDGRIQLNLSNRNAPELTVRVGELGNIYLQIPTGGVHVDLVGPPLKGRGGLLGTD